MGAQSSKTDPGGDLEAANKIKMDGFVLEQKELLKLEKVAEAQREKEELRENGEVISVEVLNCGKTPYRGTMVTFKNRNPNKKHPNIRRGENVALDPNDGSEPLAGILIKIGFNKYDVAVEEDPELFRNQRKWDLIKTSNLGQFDELEKSLDAIPNTNTPLRNVLFGIQPPKQVSPAVAFLPGAFRNTSLDKSQKEAVVSALNQAELSVVHGPPGTGKTTTLVEIIWQCVQSGEKVLVTSASNVAVDNLGERLAREGISVIRIGHPARVSENMIPHALGVKLGSEKVELEKIKVDLERVKNELHSKSFKNRPEIRERYEQELKLLQQKRDKVQAVLKRLSKAHLLKASVVLSTLVGCREKGPLQYLPEDHFKTTVIDECGQAMEMACWIAIPKAPRLILAGDHLQLPPTVISDKAKEKLSISLMERLRERFFYGAGKSSVFHMLNVQYRMNEKIMTWSSRNFYHGFLYAAEAVSDRHLCDLPGITSDSFTKCVLKLYDSACQNLREISNESKRAKSFGNMGEAAIVVDYVERLVSHGVTADMIAVIAPYNYQVEIIKANLLEKYPELEVKSVDGFQGREKEVVIISMVRSNEAQNLGFLVEKRRLNVAVTRARRQLVLICDSETVSKDEFLSGFVEYMRTNGDVEAAPKMDTSKLHLPVRNAPPTSRQGPATTGASLPSLGNIVALDCEMVGVGEAGVTRRLARVSVVDAEGRVLIDSYVAVEEEVTKYNTKISGITPELIASAPCYNTVREQVLNILKKKIIVGHGMEHDFEVLDYYPPAATIRDSAKYFKLGKTPSLKSLVDRYLDMKIQSGEHSSVEDAQAVMKLYLMFRDKWEAGRKAGAGPKKSGEKKKTNASVVENVTRTLSQLSINNNKVVYSLKGLKTLPEDHVFSSEINKLMKGAGADQRKVMWAEQWMKRRRNRDDTNKKVGVETSIQNAFNQLSNDQLKRWIQIYKDRLNNKKSTAKDQAKKKKNDQKVSTVTYSFSVLKTLPKDHVFSGELNTLLKGKQYSKTRVLWAEEWIRRREDKPEYPKNFERSLSITLAFNVLSNKQLRKWIAMQKSNSNESTKVVSTSSKSSSRTPQAAYSFLGLKTLPKDHTFSGDLDILLKGKQNSMTRVLWAEEWIRRRKDKPEFPKNVELKTMLLSAAFNLLSNKQLQMWIRIHKTKSNLKSQSVAVTINANVASMTPTPKVVPKISEPSPSRNVNIDDKFERLKSLSPCHVFSKDDLNDVLKIQSNQTNGSQSKRKCKESVKWASEWLKRRSDKPDHPSFKKEFTLIDALNKLSNSQLKMWIELRTGASRDSVDIDRFDRLQFLPANHVFTKEDLNDILRMPSNGAVKSQINLKAKESVKWGYKWLQRRKNKPDFVNFKHDMSLLEAFNNLSNQQLKMWVQHRDRQ